MNIIITIDSVGLGKMGLDFDVCVLKGIGANTLVCIGVILGTMARSDLGKVVLIFIPIALFATIGTIISVIYFLLCNHLLSSFLLLSS